MCVRERERERENECNCACLCVIVSVVCVCDSICNFFVKRGYCASEYINVKQNVMLDLKKAGFVATGMAHLHISTRSDKNS